MYFANPSKKARTHASTKGHAIEFPGRVMFDAKGKPPADFKLPDGCKLGEDGQVYVYVPPLLRAEIAAAGFEPMEQVAEVEKPALPVKPEDPDKFRADLYAAFDTLVEANRREDFAGSGIPKSDAVEKLTGYQVTNADVKDAWPKYLQSKKD